VAEFGGGRSKAMSSKYESGETKLQVAVEMGCIRSGELTCRAYFEICTIG
jgi:hypothetical protein